jgi:hypothetical protein
MGWFFEGGGNAVEGAEAEDTAQCAFAAPAATWSDGDGARDIVFVVVHDEPERAVHEVFDEFAEPRFAAHKAFRAADYVVAVGEQAGYVGGRVGSYVENVPYVFGESEG